MNNAPSTAPPVVYNYTYTSPLYAEVRSIADLPDFPMPQGGNYSSYVSSTQIAGTLVIRQDSRSKEKFVEADFYKDELDLAPLTDDLIQIYE